MSTAAPDFKTALVRALPSQGSATIVSVTPYRVCGERSQADGFCEERSVIRPLTFAVVYRYEMRLFNLVVPERLDEGLKRTIKRSIRADIEDRRYRESPLDAIHGQLPITFEV